MFDLLMWLFFISLGIAAGTLTGLTPGLHINTLALLIFGLYLSLQIDPLPLTIFIASMGVTHSFVEFIPSIFFGAADPESVLAIPPGHRMLLKGEGYEALVLTVVGGIFGMVFLLALFPLLLPTIPALYALLRPQMHFVLIFLMSIMVAIEKRRVWALAIFLLAGFYGIFAMRLPLNQNFILFPVLTGLFGLSALLLSYRSVSKIPEQKIHLNIDRKASFTGSGLGFLGGVLAGILPGFGSAQSAVLVQYLARLREAKNFLLAVGTINTINIIFSIFAIYLIGNPRSGAAVVIEEILGGIGFKEALLFLGVGLVAAGIAASLTLFLGKRIVAFVEKINYKKLVLAIISSLLCLVFVFTGPAGIFIAVVGTAIGMLPQLLGVKKSLCMACLILPTILFFAGIGF